MTARPIIRFSTRSASDESIDALRVALDQFDLALFDLVDLLKSFLDEPGLEDFVPISSSSCGGVVVSGGVVSGDVLRGVLAATASAAAYLLVDVPNEDDIFGRRRSAARPVRKSRHAAASSAT